jgi:hypothetical protein
MTDIWLGLYGTRIPCQSSCRNSGERCLGCMTPSQAQTIAVEETRLEVAGDGTCVECMIFKD